MEVSAARGHQLLHGQVRPLLISRIVDPPDGYLSSGRSFPPHGASSPCSDQAELSCERGVASERRGWGRPYPPQIYSKLVMLGLFHRWNVSMKRTVPERQRITIELVEAPPE